MDSVPFLAQVKGYHDGGWRLALINATAVIPVAAPAHGHAAAGAPAVEPAPAATAPAATAPAATAPAATAPAATAPAVEPAAEHAPAGDVAGADVASADVFEISWAFARGTEFETIRQTVTAGEQVPSVSEFFGAAFLYENEIRELFGIDVTGVNVDLKGQLYKTAQRVPFSHQAIKARLEANAAAAARPAAKAAKANPTAAER